MNKAALALLAAIPLGSIAHGADLDSLIKTGDGLDAKNQSEKALPFYLQAEKLAPADAEVLRRVARAYGEMMADTASQDEKRVLGEKALSYARRAVGADPNNAQAQLAAAVCYGRVAPLLDNKTKIAYSRLVKEHVDRSLALDACNDLAYHVLGVWNYELTNLNPVLRAIAGAIYGEVPATSYQEAVKDFQKALQLNPNRLANHVELGRTYAAMGNAEGARAELTRALSMPDRDKDDPYEKERARETLRNL